MEEFSRAGSAGKILRTAFRLFLQECADNRMSSRLTKAMMEVVKADENSTRGQRNVLDCELELLEGFDFNLNAKLPATIFFPYMATIDRVTGTLKVSIPAFIPNQAVVAPEGATHLKLVSGGASINFSSETFEVVTSDN